MITEFTQTLMAGGSLSDRESEAVAEEILPSSAAEGTRA